jgi:hypothetical protein
VRVLLRFEGADPGFEELAEYLPELPPVWWHLDRTGDRDQSTAFRLHHVHLELSPIVAVYKQIVSGSTG